MNDAYIQLASAFFGTMGFAILFRVRKSLLFPTSFGGLLTWAVYLLAEVFFQRIIMITLIAAICGAFYAEAMARICKTPAIVFFLPAVIALVPGKPLFYTVRNAAEGNWSDFQNFGSLTMEYALGIAAGMCLACAFFDMLRRILALCDDTEEY